MPRVFFSLSLLGAGNIQAFQSEELNSALALTLTLSLCLYTSIINSGRYRLRPHPLLRVLASRRTAPLLRLARSLRICFPFTLLAF